VHVCDSVKGDGSSHQDRNVWTGGGVIPLKRWLDAVASTGFDGWYAGELFSEKHWELDPWDTARVLRDQLEYLLI
jgi:sugar phosphate isomerase/epimerase